MPFRDVRIREMNNRLAFRFDPDNDVIELVINKRLVAVALEDYRLHQVDEDNNEADESPTIPQSD